MKKLLPLLLVLSLFACAENPNNSIEDSAQHAWGPKSPKKANYHWSSDNLNPTVLNNSIAPYGVSETIVDWNALATPIQPVEVASGTFDIEVYEDGTSSDNWIGLAKIWLDGSHIIRAEVIMNTVMINEKYSHLENLPQHVLCQEFGHVLGLDHNHESLNTCMNDCTTAKTRSEWEFCINHPNGTTPDEHDTETLLSSYDHVDLAPGGEGGDGSGPGPCGKNPNHPLCQVAPTLVFTFPAPEFE